MFVTELVFQLAKAVILVKLEQLKNILTMLVTEYIYRKPTFFELNFRNYILHIEINVYENEFFSDKF